MTPGWKQVAKAFGFVLLFGIVAWNLYAGAGIFMSIFRGVVAWLIFQILNIILTNIVVRQLSEYEYKRLRKIAEEEELEEIRQAETSAALEEDLEEASTEARPKVAQPASTAASEKEAESVESGESG
jgi:biopolymer transport protein ExbB/TolQ